MKRSIFVGVSGVRRNIRRSCPFRAVIWIVNASSDLHVRKNLKLQVEASPTASHDLFWKVVAQSEVMEIPSDVREDGPKPALTPVITLRPSPKQASSSRKPSHRAFVRLWDQ